MRIVLVDDESLIAEGLARMLAAQGDEDWNLTAVYRDAEEALETCDWDSVDVLLADINMPGINGLEMVEILRDRGWETPVIIVSGHAQFDYARAAMLHRAVDFIVKPVAPDELFSALRKAREILRERAAERTSRRFIESNLDRLMRELLSEKIFEARKLPEEEQRILFDSCGPGQKSYALLVLLAGQRREAIPALLDALKGDCKAAVYCYPSGSGLNTVLAVGTQPTDFDPGIVPLLAEKLGVDIAWSGCVRTDCLDALHALYIGLLEQMRDSGAGDAVRVAPMPAAGTNLPDPSAEFSPPVSEAIRLIQRDYAKPLSLTILSEKAGVHPTYLSNIFHKQTGLTLIDYLNQYRIERAKALLEDPLTRIYWVGEQVGFANQRYFSQVFKKTTGLTPVEYRSSCYLRGH